MLFDESKNYKEIDDNTFNNDLERFKGSSDIVGTIYLFFRDEKGNIIKKIRNNISDLKIEDSLTLISKYYVVRIKVDEPLNFQFEDTGDAYKIFNLGNFYISNLFKMSEEKSIKIREMFNNYDEKYKEFTFQYSDDEFLLKYNKRNI